MRFSEVTTPVVLDAVALVALMREEPAAADVQELLERRRGRTLLSTATRAEVIDVLSRRYGFDNAQVESKLDLLRLARLEDVPVSVDHASRAAAVRIGHYHHKRCPLSMCDCIVLAVAEVSRAALATADSTLARVALKRGTPVVPLPTA